MRVYYNEIDDYCCDWLSNLMDAGAITPGVIDNRSVEDVVPSDLEGFDRVHFFAGIGVWEYAFVQSGLSGYSGIWTGSCPCQPFSAAGKTGGFADERHLWPAFFHLIEECGPTAVLGEQVASKDGLPWLDLVSADLEGADYAFGAGDLCAAGYGAPHVRQRLYWSAFGLEHSSDNGLQGRLSWRTNPQWEVVDRSLGCDGSTGHLAYPNSREREQQSGDGRPSRVLGSSHGEARSEHRLGYHGAGDFGVLADTEGSGRGEEQQDARRLNAGVGEGQIIGRAGDGETDHPLPTDGFWRDADWLSCRDGSSSQLVQLSDSTYGSGQPEEPRTVERFLPQGDGTLSAFSGGTGPTNGFWRVADWLSCRDGKWRAVEPGTFPLAHGATARVGRLRAYGNAIVAPQAIEFCRSIRQFIETINSDI